MATMCKKEEKYKDALLLKIRSYVNRSEALHLQDRAKEVISVDDFLRTLDYFMARGKIDYPKRYY